MADVQSVVADLRSTSKGSLVYNDKNWTTILSETSSVPKLHISAFAIKDNSRLVGDNERGSSTIKAGPDFKNYFSPERATEKKKSSTLHQTQHKHKKQLDMHQTLWDTNQTLPDFQTVSNHQQRSSERLLRDVDNEYEETLKSITNMRLNHMKARMLQFESEYHDRLSTIDQNLYEKYEQDNQIIANQQNTLQNSEEITFFDTVRRKREQVAKERAQQTQSGLQHIQLKQRQFEERKQATLEKKKTLSRLAETISQLVSTATKNYKQFKADYQTQPPDDCTQLFNQLVVEYQQCATTIRSAVTKNYEVLDQAVQLVTAKSSIIQDQFKKCDEALLKLKTDIEIKRKKEKEDAAKAKTEAAAAAAVTTTMAASTAVSVVQTNQVTQPSVASESVASIEEAVPALAPLKSTIHTAMNLLSFKPAFDGYLNLQKLLMDTVKLHEPISASKDKLIKSYKFDLYKVINTQINAISSDSPKHLMDKIIKLNALLTEGNVETGGKLVSVKGKPKALALVKDLVAKKLVMQGQLQVASSFTAAFPTAAVCIGLWSLCPDVGDLLLGHFYSKCPFLVPFYIPKTDQMTAVEYCKLVGYDVDGDTVEDEDKFLAKLSGMVRLYAAMMQMEMPPQLSGRPHPFGIENGWTWFTRLMNLEPRPSVTATIIFDFLEVAGHALLKRFGKQFQKVLLTLCKDLMPKILQVTPSTSKAGATRLKMFLEKCVKEGKIKPPEGILTQRWWNTGHS